MPDTPIKLTAFPPHWTVISDRFVAMPAEHAAPGGTATVCVTCGAIVAAQFLAEHDHHHQEPGRA